MTFDIITIFPHIFDSYINESILKRAQEKKKIQIRVHNLRDYTTDKHHKVDDSPYGGGPGMVLMPEPLVKAIKTIKGTGDKGQVTREKKKTKVILLSPAGKTFDQNMAKKFAKLNRLIFVCGRYEGIDARVEKFVDEKISIGDYVISGGELPALVITEAITRLIPGVLGKFESTEEESFSENGILEYPHYTRPEIFHPDKKTKLKVPPVLLSGNHAKIADWRKKHSKKAS